MQATAIDACSPLLTDPESYRLLWPPVVRSIAATKSYSMVVRASEMTKGFKDASPEIQTYVLGLLQDAYVKLPEQMVSERGIWVIPNGASFKRSKFGRLLGFSEAGEAFLNSRPKATSAWKITGKDEDRFVFSGELQRNQDFEGTWCFVSHEKVSSEEDARTFINKQIEKNRVPKMGIRGKKITYGFEVKEDGSFKPLGYSGRTYPKPLRYSGNMIFSTFFDKAYRYKIFMIGDRMFAMAEEDFEPERDEAYVPVYKTYVKVSE